MAQQLDGEMPSGIDQRDPGYLIYLALLAYPAVAAAFACVVVFAP